MKTRLVLIHLSLVVVFAIGLRIGALYYEGKSFIDSCTTILIYLIPLIMNVISLQDIFYEYVILEQKYEEKEQ